MINNSISGCPICSSQNTEIIFSLECGNIDNSFLYPEVNLNVCTECGHVFNKLSQNELDGLYKYYNQEYAPTNIVSKDIQGDRPGSQSKYTFERYSQLYDTIEPFLTPEVKILDVGCAMGGFLEFLHQKGFRNLFGVDMTENYVEQAKNSSKFTIELGNADQIPFEDNTFDVVVMEQVLEHVHAPVAVFKEIKRVVKTDGVFSIGVPDALRYQQSNFFDFYWILLREHIQHFDNVHIKILAENNGFEVIENRETNHFVMSDKMVMPNLYTVLKSVERNKKTDDNTASAFHLIASIQNYLNQERIKLENKREQIANIIKSKRPVYVWGIGREFLYLYENAGLKECNIAGLIDRNELKKSTYSINGIKISDENILSHSSLDAVLFITAFAHIDSISVLAKELGFKGEVFEFDDSQNYSK